MDFRSDNTAAASPEILEALARANAGRAPSYGADALTAQVRARFGDLFEQDVDVFLVPTGTAANAIALAALCDPWGAILCHREAHIETDECGAPGFFAQGAKLVLIDGDGAKITPAALQEALARNQRGVHSVLPQAISLTQCTERGAVYAPEELEALRAVATQAQLHVHMDGARFANAVAALNRSPRDVARGVDLLSFGATKNGAFAAEAIVAFNPAHNDALERLRKRAGHLLSKHRFIAAQIVAYLENDLWLRNAARANALAQRIAAAAPDWLSEPVMTNHVFIKPGARALKALRERGAQFYEWGASGDEARLVVSWDQDEAEIAALCAAISEIKSR